MATTRHQHTTLQLIFAFFLGLMVTAFMGVGVFTYYPDRLDAFEEKIRVLWDEKQLILDGRGMEGLTRDEEARVAGLVEQIREAEKQLEERRQAWARTTSIILVVIATLVLSVSLVRADQLRVISSGLLLGGVFSMLYGTGWILASGESQARFWVMAFALLVTLSLGYVRFVRRSAAKRAAGASAAGARDLANRVEQLERKVNAAAEAMGRSS